jgi:hypothetical protein
MTSARSRAEVASAHLRMPCRNPLGLDDDVAILDVQRKGLGHLWPLGQFQCRSCRKVRYAPPVHMIGLTEEPEITPYVWVHPDDDR